MFIGIYVEYCEDHGNEYPFGGLNCAGLLSMTISLWQCEYFHTMRWCLLALNQTLFHLSHKAFSLQFFSTPPFEVAPFVDFPCVAHVTRGSWPPVCLPVCWWLQHWVEEYLGCSWSVVHRGRVVPSKTVLYVSLLLWFSSRGGRSNSVQQRRTRTQSTKKEFRLESGFKIFQFFFYITGAAQTVERIC